MPTHGGQVEQLPGMAGEAPVWMVDGMRRNPQLLSLSAWPVAKSGCSPLLYIPFVGA